MPQITSIEPNVDLIETDSQRIYLIGTAHVSKNSAEQVERVILEHEPDTVCLELCESRFEALSDPERWKTTDLYTVIKSGRAYVLMAQLALSTFQKRLADEFGVRPGEEMHRAMAVAKRRGIKVSMIDRDVRTTFKRAWAGASKWTAVKIITTMFLSVFNTKSISEEEIEKLKSGDDLSVIIDEFSGSLPGVKTAMIDERDAFLAASIERAPGDTLVAVVGAAHVPGIKRLFGTDIDLDALNELPPPGKLLKVIGWGIPALILTLVVIGFFISGRETSEQMIVAWVLANGIAAAAGTILAAAHPLTILTAFVAAPITSLNPTIAAGWVCGLVEAYLRKPRVVDLENIATDLSSVSGVWKNRVTRVLLVVVLANLGSIIGTFVGAGWIIALLGN